MISIRLVCVVAAMLFVALDSEAQQQIQVQWSTYLGGSGRDEMRDVDCDVDENAYVCGVFQSTDFPTPRNVYGPQDNTGPGYLAKFSQDGELLWLMWFQGFLPHEVATSNTGYVAVCGSVAVGANSLGGTQSGSPGSTDAAFVLVSADGERLASAAFGGTGDDVATTIDIRFQSIFVGGITSSSDLPTTANAAQRTYGGGGSLGQGIGDGLLAKFSLQRAGASTTVGLNVLTYYGGRYLDEILCLRAKNTLGELYIGGRTRSDNLPGSAYVTTGKVGDVFNDDAFVSRLDSNLRPVWRMYVGGDGNDVVYSIQPRLEFDQSGAGVTVSVTACGTYNGAPLHHPERGRRIPADDLPYAGGTLLGGDAFCLQTSGFFNAVRWVRSVSTTADDLAVAIPRQQSTFGHPFVLSNGELGSVKQNNGFNGYFWRVEYRVGQDSLTEFIGNADECLLDTEQQRFGFGGRAVREGSRAEYFCGTTNSTQIPRSNVVGRSFQQTNAGGYDGYLVRTGCSDRQPKLVAADSTLCGVDDSTTISFTFLPTNVTWPDGSQNPSYVVRSAGIVRVTYTTENGCRSYEDSITIRSGLTPSGTLGPTDTLFLCGDADSVVISLTGSSVDSVVWSGGRPVGNSTLIVRQAGTYSARLFSRDGCSVVTNSIIVRNRSLDSSTRIVSSIDSRDSISPGSRFSIVLRLVDSTNNQDVADEWTADIRYDGSVLFPLFPTSAVVRSENSVFASLSLRRTTLGDTLAILPFRAALGETDSVLVELNNIAFPPCDTLRQQHSIPISIAGICRENGIPRFINTRSVRLAIGALRGLSAGEHIDVTIVGSDAGQAVVELWSVVGEPFPLIRQATSDQSSSWRSWQTPPSGMYVIVVRSSTEAICYPMSILR